MFYQELSQIETYSLMMETINELDTILAFLNKNEQDRITASNIANKLNIELSIATFLLNKCCELGILEKQYGILCPECNMTLKICSQESLIDEITKINTCYACDKDDIIITTDDVIIMYKLIKRPTGNKSEMLEKLGNLGNPIKTSQDTLKHEFDNKISYPNSFFYCPTEDESRKLHDLYINIDKDFKNTTQKGNALNELAEYLLSLLRGFSVDSTVRTRTNQIDVTGYNRIAPSVPDSSFIPSIYNDIGTFFVVECKNEKEKPDNTYYHKICNIIRLTGGKFGIIFSKLPITFPCTIIAHDNFLLDKHVVINIDLSDLHKIIVDRVNFIDVIAIKIFQVKATTTTDLYSTKLINCTK